MTEKGTGRGKGEEKERARLACARGVKWRWSNGMEQRYVAFAYDVNPQRHLKFVEIFESLRDVLSVPMPLKSARTPRIHSNVSPSLVILLRSALHVIRS